MKKHILLLALLLGVVSCGNLKSERERSVISASLFNPVQVDEYVNEHRIKLALKPLIFSPVIEEVATDHSASMGKRSRLSHWGLKYRCNEMKNGMGEGNLCGEIIASGEETPKDVFQAWLNSKQEWCDLLDAVVFRDVVSSFFEFR